MNFCVGESFEIGKQKKDSQMSAKTVEIIWTQKHPISSNMGWSFRSKL